MTTIRWDRFPQVQQEPLAQAWLTNEADLGLGQNTVEAYGRAVEDFLGFLARSDLALLRASRADIAAYVRELSSRPRRHKVGGEAAGPGRLANATLQQRITAIGLLYDYVVEEGLRWDNPLGRRQYTPTRSFGGTRGRALIPRYRKLPWIPTDTLRLPWPPPRWALLERDAHPHALPESRHPRGRRPGHYHQP